MNPLISVIIPSYKTKHEWLVDALESVVNQSIPLDDFEILVCNDSPEEPFKFNFMDEIRLDKFKNIKFFENECNKGIAFSLNKLIKEAKGKYIARMDADDIIDKYKFYWQLSYLIKNPNCKIVGTGLKVFGDTKDIYEVIHENIVTKEMLIQKSWRVNHATVMWDRDYFIKNNIWYTEGVRAEDIDLWCQVLSHTEIHNIDKVLYKYRIHNNMVTKNIKELLKSTEEVISKYREKWKI